MKKFFNCILLVLLISIMHIIPAPCRRKKQFLLESPGTDRHPFRIPAITMLKNGNILTVSYFRWRGSNQTPHFMLLRDGPE